MERQNAAENEAKGPRDARSNKAAMENIMVHVVSRNDADE
jgi:hypothetical protein